MGKRGDMKPVKRTRLRIALGKIYYTTKRYIEWYMGKNKYSNTFKEEPLGEIYFTHKTPMLRKLRDVDMALQYNKIINLRLAVEKIDGILVKPGEAFSYWRLIGKPSKRKGYVDGMVLYCGGFKAGTGGGLCQLSNLIYWMTLHTPLTVTERYRHSYDVFPDSNMTQPFGSGATCVYNYRDLQILNGTSDTFQLHVYINGDYLVGEWRTLNKPDYTYEIYEREHKINHEFWGGYTRHNMIFRRVYSNDGIFLRDEYVTENHAIMMYEPFLTE